MRRLRARAPKGGAGVRQGVPRNRGKNQALIASVTLEGGMGAAVSIEGSTDAELFETYVEEFLAPTLEAGQVVVLDGLGAHRTERVRELVEGRGAELLFLPPYSSPELNPIEEAFSKIKNRCQEGRCAHPRGAKRGHLRGDLGHHARRRGGLVRTLRLPTTGSTVMNSAVSGQPPDEQAGQAARVW